MFIAGRNADGQMHRQPVAKNCYCPFDRNKGETQTELVRAVTLTLDEANSIVSVAIAKARELNITVSVAVCDDLGHLIALNRMDGAHGEADRFAIGKAIVSSSTGVPSGEVQGQVDHPPGAYVVAQGVPAIRVRGGLPVVRNGQIEGACGVGGGSSHEQEEECARAGIASIQQ